MKSEVNNTAKTGRIAYIDALRGFTMFLVVFGHVMLESFDLQAYDTVLGTTFLAFRMPMFFFISGYIGFKALEKWDLSFFSKMTRKKMLVQTVPALFFFSLYMIMHGISPLWCLKNGWGGYWFTFVLLEMFLIYYTASLLGKYLKFKYSLEIIGVIVSLIGIALAPSLEVNNAPWCKILCLNNLSKYFQFFFLGLMCRKYNDRFFKFIGNDIVRFIIIVGFIAGMIIYFNEAFETHFALAHKLTKNLFVRYLGVFLVFIFFYSKRDYWKQENAVTRSFTFIGRRTLDIYLIHHFLFPDITVLHDWLAPNQMIVMQFALSTIVALLIIGVCLIISEIIRTSNTLAHFILGVNRNK